MRSSQVAFSARETWHLVGDQRVLPTDLRTIGDFIGYWARLHPDRPAVLVSEGAPLTFLGLWREISGFRSALRQAGFGPKSRIGVALGDGPHAALALVAVACCAVAVPLAPNLAAEELGIRLARLQLDAVLVLQGHTPAARVLAEGERIQVLEIRAQDRQALSLSFLAPLGTRGSALNDSPSDEVAYIFQSSGTTAEPKLIPCSHLSILVDARKAQIAFELSPQDRCLCVAPVCYSQGLRGGVLTALLTGGSVAFPRSAAEVNADEWLLNLRPTWYVAAPTLHLAILEKVRSRSISNARLPLRFILNSGAALPLATHNELTEWLGIPVLQYYGLGEAGQVSANQLRPGRSKPGTCGIPWPGLMIVDSKGAECPAGEAGEIWVRGPAVVSGYIYPPELNRTAFVDGWFRTGDLGCLDEDGFLTLLGRTKEVINRGGEKISPAEIDAALMRHPDVLEAAAYGVPHPRLGEIVGAAVVLRSGARLSSVDLRTYLQGMLSWSKVPRHIDICESIARGPTGKFIRRNLGSVAEG